MPASTRLRSSIVRFWRKICAMRTVPITIAAAASAIERSGTRWKWSTTWIASAVSMNRAGIASRRQPSLTGRAGRATAGAQAAKATSSIAAGQSASSSMPSR